jgi:uncharacterized OsmC-like protein
VKLSVQHVDGLRFLATAEGRAIAADASLEDGGGGTALSAPQMFAAAVGACVLEFVVNSCRLREIEFERLSLEMTCEEMERPRRIGAVDAVIHMEPLPPDDVRRRLMGVARHATLINTLAKPPQVQIRFGAE